MDDRNNGNSRRGSFSEPVKPSSGPSSPGAKTGGSPPPSPKTSSRVGLPPLDDFEARPQAFLQGSSLSPRPQSPTFGNPGLFGALPSLPNESTSPRGRSSSSDELDLLLNMPSVPQGPIGPRKQSPDFKELDLLTLPSVPKETVSTSPRVQGSRGGARSRRKYSPLAVVRGRQGYGSQSAALYRHPSLRSLQRPRRTLSTRPKKQVHWMSLFDHDFASTDFRLAEVLHEHLKTQKALPRLQAATSFEDKKRFELGPTLDRLRKGPDRNAQISKEGAELSRAATLQKYTTAESFQPRVRLEGEQPKSREVIFQPVSKGGGGK